MRFLNQKFLEQHAVALVIVTLITISIGGIVEIVPLFTIETTIERVKGVRPYSPLELAGRDIYVREGCYLCHSQMVRPFRDEVERYGHYSLAAESVYDHPFQWGSERTGPDLARVGGKYSNDWHVAHLTDPRDVVPESVMPPYAFLANHPLDLDQLAGHMRTNRIVGVPYTDEMIADAKADALAQVDPNAETAGLLKRYPGAVTGGLGGDPNQVTERDALIAYLQILGTMVKFRDVLPDDLRQ